MSEHEKRYQQAMNKGHSAAWEQKWDRAASFYRHALDGQEDDPKALTSLALALFKLQEYQQSLRYYLRASKVAPKDPVPLEKAAILFESLDQGEKASQFAEQAAERYLKEKNVDKAAENWSRAVAMNPENLRAHSRLAVVYERAGRDMQAVREYLHVASLLQHSGRQEKAFQSVNRALKIIPDGKEPRQALNMLRAGALLPKPARPQGGTGPLSEREKTEPLRLEAPKEPTFSDLNPIEEAQRESLANLASLFFEQSTADNTEDPSARRGLQDIMDGSGSVFSKNADHTKIMLHLGQAVDLQTHGDAESAADELKGAISAGLDAPAAFYSLGMLQVKTKRLGSAKRNLQKVMSHPSFSLGARLLLGDIWYQRTKYKNAAMRYLEALRAADAQVVSQEQADELRELYDPLIETLSREKDENLQKQLCDNISNLLVRPNWRQRLSNARQQLDDHGDIPIPLAEMLVGASSSDVVVAMSTVRDLARDGHLGSALEEILFALQQSPTYLPLHILLGDILMSRGNLDEAAQKFNVVARAYSIRGEAHRAIVVLRRIIELDPMNLDIRIRLIDHLTASGKIDDANKEYLLLAGIYYSLAELKKARQAYSQALQLSKQSKNADSWRVRIFHRIADIDMQSLNWRQAIKLYKQIRVLRPGDVDACRSLINLYSSLGESGQVLEVMDAFIAHANEIGEPEQAIEFLQSVIAEQPDKAMIHYRLAAQCQQTHRTSEAIQHYDNASELLLDAGDKAGAKELIQKIIKLNPSNKEEYEKALESL